MKKVFYALLGLMLPACAIAQPVIDSAEYYHVGQMFNYRHCSNIAPGPAGANQTWNFSSVTDSLVEIDTVMAATSPANAKVTFNGITNYLSISDTETALTGIDLTAAASISYDSNITVAKHPMTYLDTASSMFTETVNAQVNGSGGGTSFMEADGYGTLTTPQGTFTNVLRVKFTQNEVDSFGIGSETFHIVSYRWFDSSHAYPLMRIDSMTGVGLLPMSIISTAYYTTDTPTAVRNVSPLPSTAAAHLDNNGITLKAELAQGGQYQITLVNMNGQVIYSKDFTASGNREHFNTGMQLPAGNYLLSLSARNQFGKPVFIKVTKE